MNDEELISRLESMLPEELTPEELALLRRRAAASPAVREALSRWLQFEQVMAGGLSRYRLPIDLVLARAAVAATPPGGILGRLLGWGLAGTALVALSLTLYLVTRDSQANRQTVAGRAEPDKDLKQSASSKRGGGDQPGRKKSTPSTVRVQDAGTGVGTAPLPSVKAMVDKSPSDVPPGPLDQQWLAQPQKLGTEEPPASRMFAVHGKRQGFTELVAQLAIRQGRVEPAPEGPEWGLSLDGMVQWQAAWPEGHALRLWLVDHHGMELRLEGNTASLVLRYYEFPEPAWAAYEVAPENALEGPSAGTSRPRMALAALDNGRLARSGRGPIDLVWRPGRLEMQRADMLLLSAPLQEPPTTVVLAGRAKLRYASVLPASVTLQEFDCLAGLNVDTPAAAFDWQPVPQAQLRTEAQGRIELTGDAPVNRAAVRVARSGLSVLTFEMEAPQAGTGIFAADAAGRPLWHLGFFTEPHSNGLVCAATPQPEMGTSREADLTMLPTALVADRVWLRLLPATAGWKAYISTDGRWWSRMPIPPLPAEVAVARVGIYSLPGRTVRLQRLNIQDLHVLLALAPASLYEQAPALADVTDWAAWQARVLLGIPSQSDAGDWQAACALKTLADGAASSLAPHLLVLLADRVAALGPPAALRLQQLHALALLCGEGDERTASELARAYWHLAGELAMRGERLSTAIWRAVCVATPLGSLDPLDERLWRTEALQIAAQGEVQALQALALPAGFLAACLGRETPLAAVLKAGLHPLVDRPGREEVNLLAELREALQLGAYRDACHIISSSSLERAGGLLPDSADPMLHVSLATAVANAMEQHPDLRAAMRQHFGPLARLRVKRAMAEENEEAADAATVQFFGTDAAVQAHTWLGDRALAAGNFVRARGHYRAALKQGDGPARARAAAMLRLTAALQGKDEGEPPQGPVCYSGQELSPAEFEALVAELRAAHTNEQGVGGGSRVASTHVGQALPAEDVSASLVAPGTSYAARPASRIELLPAAREVLFDSGARPAGSRGIFACGLRLVNQGPNLVLCAPDAVYLLDGSGGLRGAVPFSGTADASGLLCAPLELASGLCLARRVDGGAELTLLDASVGQEIWHTNTSASVCSNPIWAEQSLRCLLKRSTPDGLVEICLATFDVGTGVLASQEPLVQFEQGLSDRVWGQLILAADRLLALVEGCAVCCDISGRVIWLRRQAWLPPAWRQAVPAPQAIAFADYVWLASPGAQTLQCCRLDVGRLEWQQQLPEPFEIAGIANEALVLRGLEWLYGLDRCDGRRLWRVRMRDPQAAVQCEGAYVIAAIAQRLAAGRVRPALQWIDAATGCSVACTPIDGLPTAQAGGVSIGRVCSWQQRLWVPFAVAEARELGVAELVPSHEVATHSAAASARPVLSVRSPLAETVGDVLPGWQWVDGPEDDTTGVVPELLGARNVLVTLAQPQRPTRMAARFGVRRGSVCHLEIEWSQPLPARWRLVLRTADETLCEQVLEPSGGGWQTLQFDLTRFAGREMLLLEQQALDTGAAYVAWKACRIVEE